MLTYTPDPTKMLSRTGLEDLHIESMADTVRSSRNTSQPGSNDRDLWSTKLHSRLGGFGRQKFVQEPLYKLVEENEWMEDWVLHAELTRKRLYFNQWSRTKHEGGRRDPTYLLFCFEACD